MPSGSRVPRRGSLFEQFGTMTKSSHCGYAGVARLEAALLTERGFTGNRALFDAATQGFRHAFLPDDFEPEFLYGLRRAVSGYRSGLRYQAVSREVQHALRHHRRVGPARSGVARAHPRRARSCGRGPFEQPAEPQGRARGQVQRSIHGRGGAPRRPSGVADLHRRTAVPRRHAGAAAEDCLHHGFTDAQCLQLRPLR